ncbi:unnamed protein product, partial [Schistosoma spindalis]
MRRRSEFMVGEKFRVRVVLSEDLKNHSQYDLFKGFNYWLFPYLRHDDGSPRTRRNQHTGEPDLPKEANEGLKAD